MALLRGRARTLASLTSLSRSGSSTQLAPQEVQLPRDPYVNGQPIEAYLYKDAQECPICFLYYPPYLNKTRCCDQPICSECFVQIKRPDPHPPEHHEDSSTPNPEQTKPEEEDGQLVSEPSACPFCVTPEFGVTYEPPMFKRGLIYAGATSPHPLAAATSAMSSSTSLGSMGSRRRTTSLSVTDKAVITTDKVRPDWAKKLADARAHALRRSAAATALHNAAYVLGNTQSIDLRTFNLGRRRRTLFGEGTSGGQSTPEGIGIGALFGRSDGQQSGDDGPTLQRGPGRSRMDDLEELMMMEAIRLSLAAEDERKRKEEKEAAKEAKKKAKQDAKDAKKAEKLAKKAEKSGSLYAASTNQSTSTWASTSMTRSTSNLGFQSGASSPPVQGKGKAPAASAGGFQALNEPTSTLNRDNNRSTDEAQRYLEESRANLPQPSQPISVPAPGNSPQRTHNRQFSGASSIGSSILESGLGSLNQETGAGTPPLSSAEALVPSGSAQASGSHTPTQGEASTVEPMFNFRSLAAMIGEEKEDHVADHKELVDDVQTPATEYRVEDVEYHSPPIEHKGNGDLGHSGEGSVSEDRAVHEPQEIISKKAESEHQTMDTIPVTTEVTHE